MAAETLLVQFAREPVPGRVKTRMMPHLGPQAACELHCELVDWTCRQLLAAGLGPVELCVAGNPRAELFARLRDLGVARVTRQKGSDLGERMLRALQCGLARHEGVVLVGSDCPALSPGYLAAAVAALETAPVVLGPAQDGGYVLIGARRVVPAIFEGVEWGGAGVYRRTVANLEGAGLDFRALPPLADVDRPEDLPAWEALRDGVSLL